MLHKEKFNTLYQALKKNGYEPTISDLQRIILDRVAKVMPTYIAGKPKKIIETKAEALRIFISNEEIKRAQKSARESGSKVSPQALIHSAKMQTVIPKEITIAFLNLPNEPEALGTIKDYAIINHELLVKEEDEQ